MSLAVLILKDWSIREHPAKCMSQIENILRDMDNHDSEARRSASEQLYTRTIFSHEDISAVSIMLEQVLIPGNSFGGAFWVLEFGESSETILNKALSYRVAKLGENLDWTLTVWSGAHLLIWHCATRSSRSASMNMPAKPPLYCELSDGWISDFRLVLPTLMGLDAFGDYYELFCNLFITRTIFSDEEVRLAQQVLSEESDWRPASICAAHILIQKYGEEQAARIYYTGKRRAKPKEWSKLRNRIRIMPIG